MDGNTSFPHLAVLPTYNIPHLGGISLKAKRRFHLQTHSVLDILDETANGVTTEGQL